jgi:hypothetical protein
MSEKHLPTLKAKQHLKYTDRNTTSLDSIQHLFRDSIGKRSYSLAQNLRDEGLYTLFLEYGRRLVSDSTTEQLNMTLRQN